MILFLHQNRFGEMYHYITCSPMDPLQWMGAVRMRVQTADKNITIIHTTPVHQLTSYELKSCMFIRNKLIKTFQTSNCFFQLKSIIHNIVPPVKRSLSESGENYAQFKHHLQVKTVQNSSKQIYPWIFCNASGQQKMDFFTGGSIIMDYG